MIMELEEVYVHHRDNDCGVYFTSSFLSGHSDLMTSHEVAQIKVARAVACDNLGIQLQCRVIIEGMLERPPPK